MEYLERSFAKNSNLMIRKYLNHVKIRIFGTNKAPYSQDAKIQKIDIPKCILFIALTILFKNEFNHFRHK